MATLTTDVRDRLARDIAAIGRDCPPPHVPASLAEAGGTRTDEPFGRWLLAQQDRGDWIDELAVAARRDPAFPKHATPAEVRDYLGRRGISDPDVFEQVDDAERCWRSL